MTRAPVAVIGLIAVAIGLPIPRALAAGRHHLPAAHPVSHAPQGFFHGPRGFFHGRRGFFAPRPSIVLLTPGPFLPFGYYDYGYDYGYPAAPPVAYPGYTPGYGYPGLPPGYGAPAVYQPPAYDPPAYYAPSSQLEVPPPSPHVVVYATGRYELRGDGVSMPYTWVWVPNPPAGPPEEPVPARPKLSAPARDQSMPARPDSAPGGGVSSSHVAYRWTDEHGVTTWTDRLDKVPARYRAQARAEP